MVRRTKKAALPYLPKKSRTVLVLEGDYRKILSMERRAAEGFGGVDAVLEGVEGQPADFEQLSAVRRETGLVKVEKAIQICRGMLENVEKLVVFFYTTDVGRKLEEAFSAVGCCYVDGGTSSAERDAAVQDFQTRRDRRVFVGQIVSAGVGVTLTAASSAVFVEADWTPANLVQAEDRLHRIGQDNAVSLYYIVLPDSIDKRVVELLAEKESQTGGVL
jgi:SWI/SNF-related matrix-associated actin-dependent regulator 1 of chromatin subfamily A